MVTFGTRPEAVKLAPVVSALMAEKSFRTVVVVTGQHREMLDPLLKLFDIKPEFDLRVMTHNQTLFQLTGRVLRKIERVLHEVQPDCVLVQGDTSTAFLTALGCYYKKVPVGHVEAGLRTENKYSPFPEEMNRRLIASIAEWHFAPTERAREALLKEHVNPASIFVTGNTGLDAVLQVSQWARTERLAKLHKDFPFLADEGLKIVLVTAHRRENLGHNLREICVAILEIVHTWPNVRVIFPVHLNPAVRRVVLQLLDGHDGIVLCEPVDYPELIYILTRAYCVLTDSGGIQEEATFLGKPFLVLRDCTERPEGITQGPGRLAGVRAGQILKEAAVLLNDVVEYRRRSKRSRVFGDGHAAAQIVRILKQVINR